MHPVVRVSAADQDKDSKIKKCTNNPSFNEVTFTSLKFYLTHVNTHFPPFLCKVSHTLEKCKHVNKKKVQFPLRIS